MGHIRWKKFGFYRQEKTMGLLGKKKLWGL
jgi:hypothetical protein